MGKGGGGGMSDRQLRMQLEQQRDLFTQGQEEGARRYDQDFGEGLRRYDQGFGEDTRRYDQGFGEDVRRFGLEQGRRQESLQRGLEQGQGLENLYSGALPELQGMEESIISQSTPGQEQARQATIAALARSGVRGPQAALEVSRQSGMMSNQMQDQLNAMKFQEAMDRRGNLGRFRSQRSLQGLGGQG
tara:strand:- start:11487 stop:12050 length:564 start_codon:yes stop_codon:yes gene_type:complete